MRVAQQGQNERAGFQMPFRLCQGPTIDLDFQGHQSVAIETQRSVMTAVARYGEFRTNGRERRIKIKIKRNVGHQPVRHTIIRATNDGRRGGGSVYIHAANLGRQPEKASHFEK